MIKNHKMAEVKYLFSRRVNMRIHKSGIDAHGLVAQMWIEKYSSTLESEA
jgi:transposase